MSSQDSRVSYEEERDKETETEGGREGEKEGEREGGRGSGRERVRQEKISYVHPIYRAAIYANRLYLSLIHERRPELLTTNGGDSESPHIIGHVRIHPTANIDPTCTVSLPPSYLGINHENFISLCIIFYSLVLMYTLVPVSQ